MLVVSMCNCAALYASRASIRCTTVLDLFPPGATLAILLQQGPWIMSDVFEKNKDVCFELEGSQQRRGELLPARVSGAQPDKAQPARKS